MPSTSRTFLIVVVLNMSITGLAYIFAPEWRGNIINEDHVVEQATTLTFAAAFLIGVTSIMRSQGLASRKLHALIPVAGLIGFLDELSFGERVFGFTAPTLYGIDIDGTHDLVRVAAPIIENDPAFILVPGVAALIGAYLLFRKRSRRNTVMAYENWRALWAYPPAKLSIISLIMLLLAIVLDLPSVFQFPGSRPIEEMLELNSAVALAFAAFSIKSAAPDAE